MVRRPGARDEGEKANIKNRALVTAALEQHQRPPEQALPIPGRGIIGGKIKDRTCRGPGNERGTKLGEHWLPS